MILVIMFWMTFYLYIKKNKCILCLRIDTWVEYTYFVGNICNFKVAGAEMGSILQDLFTKLTVSSMHQWFLHCYFTACTSNDKMVELLMLIRDFSPFVFKVQQINFWRWYLPCNLLLEKMLFGMKIYWAFSYLNND